MIQNMIVSELQPDGTSRELYRSKPGDSEATIMENVLKTFPQLPDSDIVATKDENAALRIDVEVNAALTRKPEPETQTDANAQIKTIRKEYGE